MKGLILLATFLINIAVVSAQSFNAPHNGMLQEEIYPGIDQLPGNSHFFNSTPTQRLDSVNYTELNGDMMNQDLFEYDAQLRVKTFFQMTRDYVTVPFKTRRKYEITYTADGKFDEYIILFHSSPGTVSSGNKYVYTYNGSTEIIREYYDLIDPVNLSWDLQYKSTYTYDTQGKLTLLQGSDYDNGQWLDDVKLLFYYHSNDQDSLELYYEYDSGWVLMGTTEYFYDSSNRLIEILDRANNYGTFENRSKETRTYFQGNLGYALEDYYFDNGGNWELAYKIDVHLDTASNLANLTYYTVDPYYTPTPELSSRVIYTYDNTYAYADLSVKGFFREFHFNHKRLTKDNENYNTTTQQWEPENYGTYYWTNLITSTESIGEEIGLSVTAYPNPANELLQFSLPNPNKQATLELFGINGQSLIKQEITSDTQIQVTDLPTGTYSYQINQEGKSYTGKVLVSK